MNNTYPVALKGSIFARIDGAVQGGGGFQLQIVAGGFGGGALTGTFNLQSGTCSPATTSGSWRVSGDGPTTTITPYANGWYRCDVEGFYNSTPSAGFMLQMSFGFGSYVGDGTSGIDLWRACVLPKAAWLFRQRAFFDDFITASTIDLNDTRTAGFKWYVHNAWPNAVAPWTTAPRTQSGDIAVSSSVLTLATDRSGLGEGLNTAADNGSGGFVGQAFYPPMYIESVANFSPTFAIGAGNPAISPVPLMTQDLGFLTANNQPHVEIDVCKANATGAGTIAPQQTTHYWNTNNTANNIYQGTAVIGSPTFTQNHTYSALYVTEDAMGANMLIQGGVNDASGWILYFFDGVYTGQDIGYLISNVASPGLTPANPSGALSGSDLRRAAIIVGAGTSWPINIDSVSVYQ